MYQRILLLLLCVFTLQPYFIVIKSQQIDCDPCIARSEYTIKVIVHGSADDVFWQSAKAAIVQASMDMGVQLDMQLYDSFDPNQMAADLDSIADNVDTAPDALVITIPSTEVSKSVQSVVEAGIPVIGFNSGYKVADELGLLGFVAQDEYLAGIAAGEELHRIATRNISKAVFLNHHKGVSSLDERFEGFKESMIRIGVDSVEELVVDMKNPSELSQKVDSLFIDGCTYDVVMLGGATAAVEVVSALVKHGCEGSVTLGTFDGEESFVTTSILEGHIAFATSQQSYLQASLPIVMASLYATTAKKSALPKLYLTGPVIINKENAPTDTIATCQEDAFPVCPNVLAPDGMTVSKCGCQDRKDVRIGAVLHGVTTDVFWDPVFASAEQAAEDMGITLELERFQPEDNHKVFLMKMAAKIITVCQSGVDGLFITIPSDMLVDAIKICQLLNVPIISINSGAEFADQLGLLQHIGQLEYEAGYGAGLRLIDAGMKIGYCFNHEPHNDAQLDRCRGFGDAIDSSNKNVTYGGMVAVPKDNRAQYKINAEDAIGMEGDWEGIAILLLGPGQINKGAINLKKDHSSLMIGSFDITDYMYPLIENGSILFGIDQQAYLQGNLPVYLLTYMAHAKQHLLNPVVQTGPDFADVLPTKQQQICEKNFFQVCDVIPEENFNFISRYALIVGYVFVAITICASFVALGWVYHNRNSNIVKAGQPQFLVLIVVGCILSILSIIPIGVETTYRYLKDPSIGELTTTENPAIGGVDFGCMAGPWLYGIGFVITFAALFAKILRVKLVYQAGQSMRRREVRIKDVLHLMGCMFSIELTLLFTWQFLSPFWWEREVTQESVDGHALESFGACTSGLGWYFVLGQLFFHIICLCYALVLCFQTKHIPTAFAESNYISLAVLCIFQVSVLGVPIAIMVYDQTTEFYFVRSCAVFLQTFTVLCLIFLPKMQMVYYGDSLPVSIVAVRRPTTTAQLLITKIKSSTVWQNVSGRVTATGEGVVTHSSPQNTRISTTLAPSSFPSAEQSESAVPNAEQSAALSVTFAPGTHSNEAQSTAQTASSSLNASPVAAPNLSSASTSPLSSPPIESTG